jgi:hypothetical protein
MNLLMFFSHPQGYHPPNPFSIPSTSFLENPCPMPHHINLLPKKPQKSNDKLANSSNLVISNPTLPYVPLHLSLLKVRRLLNDVLLPIIMPLTKPPLKTNMPYPD